MRCGLAIDGAGEEPCAQTDGADNVAAAPKAPIDFRNVRRELQPQTAMQR